MGLLKKVKMATYERCKNCNKLFRYLVESKDKEFCTDKCKREYNREKNMSIIRPIKK